MSKILKLVKQIFAEDPGKFQSSTAWLILLLLLILLMKFLCYCYILIRSWRGNIPAGQSKCFAEACYFLRPQPWRHCLSLGDLSRFFFFFLFLSNEIWADWMIKNYLILLKKFRVLIFNFYFGLISLYL